MRKIAGAAPSASRKGLLGHNEVEVFESDLVAVASSALQHLLQLVSAHRLAEFLGHAAQIVYINGTRLVLVKQLEYAHNAFARLFVAQFIGNCIQEVVKVNASRVVVRVEVRNHCVNRWVLLLKTEGLHRCLQLFGVNHTSAICVE